MSFTLRSIVFTVSLVLAPLVAAQTQIETIEINQGIGVQKNGALKFVAGRDTVVRAFLNAEATVEKGQTSATISRNGERVTTLEPNVYDGPTRVVDFQCSNRAACGNWAAGDYAFEVTVNGAAKSTSGTEYKFVERGVMRVLAVPVKANYAGTVVPVTDDRWKRFGDYVRATYPIAADNLIWEIRDEFDASGSEFDLETEAGQLALWEALVKLIPPKCSSNPNVDGCFHQVFGFIMDRPRGYPNGTLQGYTYGKPGNIGVVRDEDARATVSHEIGHTYGLGDTYNGGSFACQVNPAPDAFSGKNFDDSTQTAKCTSGRTALTGVGGTRIPAEHHPYEIGGRGALPDMAEYMGSGGKQAQFWTSQDAYDRLFDALAPPAPKGEGGTGIAATARFIQCWGEIRQNASAPGDVHLDPCWVFEDEAGVIANSTGKYMMAAVDASGTRIATAALNLDFDPVPPKGQAPAFIDLAPFGEEMAFPAATVKLQFIRDGNVVRELAVSSNVPVVSNVAPQLSSATQTGTVLVTWDATDADGDALSYEIEYNPDVTRADSEWEIIIRDIRQRQFSIDFADLPGGAHAKLRIVASDGINAGQAESREFSVAAKAPDVFIDDEPARVFLTGHELTFNGNALDLQDDDIPESNYEWRSSISGTLGFGSYLRVPSLPAGTHTITLSATNSSGLRGTDTMTIVVTRSLRRRAKS